MRGSGEDLELVREFAAEVTAIGLAAAGGDELDLNRDLWLEYAVSSAFDLSVVLGLPPRDRAHVDELQLSW